MARKSLLLVSRLKHQQVCQPSDPTVCTGKSILVSQCPSQKKTSDANSQQWLRQAQPLHKQQERGGTQRLCAQPRIRRSGPGLVSNHEQPVYDYEESLATPQDNNPVHPSDRKTMQAIAMPKKGDKVQTVRFQGGGRAQLPVSQEPKYTGIGDYARRAKAAGGFFNIVTIITHSSSRQARYLQGTSSLASPKQCVLSILVRISYAMQLTITHCVLDAVNARCHSIERPKNCCS